MNVRLIPRHQWSEVMLDGERSVKVQCQNCGTWAHLDHAIANDGAVSPSLECAVDNCKFHDHVQLDGWRGYRPKDRSATPPTAVEALRELVSASDARDVFTLEWRASKNWTDADAKRAEPIHAREKAAWAAARAALAAPTAEPAHTLQQRAVELVEKTGMRWQEAEALALHEFGIDDAAIAELQGECLTGEFLCDGDISDFVRSVLVHGSALIAAKAAQP